MDMFRVMTIAEPILNPVLHPQRFRLLLAAGGPQIRLARRRRIRKSDEGRRFLDGLIGAGLAAALDGSGLSFGDVLELRRRDPAFARLWARVDAVRLDAVETLLIDHLVTRLMPDAAAKGGEVDRMLLGIWQQLKDGEPAKPARRARAAPPAPPPAPAAEAAGDDEAELEQLIARVETAMRGMEADLGLAGPSPQG